ncbi:hypothetical protein H0I76_02365 [Limibaculum sp. M0105]|uniref:Uncharacterized protein n=1 Tax=Thermohalobaculum xanthum TaxID=2753746 RepID=A0A8J7SCP8_9RHOB|nr:hypothetical protein [Thermohalobaculum xanthum]MBK0398022.1 hypothetical protein [Thermohalobaculum xanthum]
MSDNEHRRSMDDVLTSLRRIMSSGRDESEDSGNVATATKPARGSYAPRQADDAEPLSLTDEVEPLTLTDEVEALTLTEDGAASGEAGKAPEASDASVGESADLDMIDEVDPVELAEGGDEGGSDETFGMPLSSRKAAFESTMVELDDVESVELSDDEVDLDIDAASLKVGDDDAEEMAADLEAREEDAPDTKGDDAEDQSSEDEDAAQDEPREARPEDTDASSEEVASDEAAEDKLAEDADAAFAEGDEAEDDKGVAVASESDDADESDERPLTPPDWSEETAAADAPSAEPAAMTLPAVAGETPPVDEEAALEETIRRVIREELVEGEIGNNISRNVQRMIREEVERMLARRGL